MNGLPARFGVLALAMWRQAGRLRLWQTAASLSFLSLLAIVPIFTLAFSVFAALPMFDTLRDALQRFIATNLFLPSFADSIVRYLNLFASKANQLSLAGAAVFFATAFSALLTIDRTFNEIWNASRLRSLGRRVTLYWTILTMGPLLLAVSLAVNGIVLGTWLSTDAARPVHNAWLGALPWITTTAALMLLYRLVPNAPVRWLEAMAGAVLATLLLETLRLAIGQYVVRAPTYTVVYGAFAAVPLFLLWLFLMWGVVLVGALFAANLRQWGAEHDVGVERSPARRFADGAATLLALAEARGSGSTIAPVGTLRRLFGGDAERADQTGRMLAGLGYVDRVWQIGLRRSDERERAVWHEGWVLRDDPQRLTLRPLFEALWRARPDPNAGGVIDRWMSARVGDRSGMLRIDGALLDAPLGQIGSALPDVTAMVAATTAIRTGSSR